MKYSVKITKTVRI